MQPQQEREGDEKAQPTHLTNTASTKQDRKRWVTLQIPFDGLDEAAERAVQLAAA